MKLPRYWAKGNAATTNRAGQSMAFECWGWSDVSVEDARRVGQERAQRTAQRATTGEPLNHYLYSDRPLREEVLEEFKNGEQELSAVITRNSYGCRVLNTAGAMFVDVDLPEVSVGGGVLRGLKKLFGQEAAPAGNPHEAAALERLMALVRNDSQFGVRVYRTKAGLRHLITHTLADPKSAACLKTMAALSADPLYVKLCTVQECFRARLTPKPWRCGLGAPVVSFPWPSADVKAQFQQWETRYTSASNGFATCKLVQVIGNTRVHPDIAPLILRHDQLTKATSDLPLA